MKIFSHILLKCTHRRDLCLALVVISSVVSSLVYAQEEYSLGSSSNTIAPASEKAPSDNILEDKPTNLFDDGNKGNAAVVPSSKGGAGRGFEDDPSAVQNSSGAGDGKTKPVPLKSVAVPNLETSKKVEPSAPLVSAPSNVGASVPSVVSVPAATAQPQKTQQANVTSPKSMIPTTPAPLRTEDYGAPVKNQNPLPANEFAGVPPLPGSRKNLARGQAPEVYTVEPGDTLFDVCSQLIDDGNYWPRLWSINPDIKNPHFIYPGTKLAFYPGDAQNPPYIDVVEEDDMVPVDKGPLKEAELVAQAPDVPTALPATSANVSTADERVEVIGPNGVEVDSSITNMFEFGPPGYSGDRVTFTLPAFIFGAEKERLGEIVMGLGGEVLAGDGIQVRITDARNLQVGAVLTVLRERGEVQSLESGDSAGYRYDFVGNIKVSDKIDDESYYGTVQNSQIGARPGDIVVNFLSTKRVVEGLRYIGPTSASNAEIVGMANFLQQFAGEGGLVFLDKGGLPAGSFYHIYQKTSQGDIIATSKSTDNFPGKSVGVLRIIDSTDKSSIGVVVKSVREIRVGDKLSAR